MDEKRCSKCSQIKALGEFGIRASTPDGRAPACRDCVNARLREHRKPRHRAKAPPPYYPQWHGLAKLIRQAVAESRLPPRWKAADLLRVLGSELRARQR